MVNVQIMARGVEDPRVLETMRRVPRHLFVPGEDLSLAYGDHPVSIGHDQTISQPFIVAYMTEALRLKGDVRVLEIGTGCGYQTAVLAELAKEVCTIEVIRALSDSARKQLDPMGYKNISYRVGNGRLGWPDKAPFDAILAAAAPAAVPMNLIHQLNPGGRLVIPVGVKDQVMVRYTRTSDGFESESLLSVRFVPLV